MAQPGSNNSTRAAQPASGLTLNDVFGRSFFLFTAIAVVTGAICYAIIGREGFLASFQSDLDLFVLILPRFTAAILIAAFAQVLLPRDKVARYVSEEAGLKAITIATAVGAMTPGGPMTSFPIVRALKDAGTGRSPLIAYVTSWSTIGFQRVINWELPLLGPEVAAIRYVASIPLPFIAGLTARILPATPDPPPAEADRKDA